MAIRGEIVKSMDFSNSFRDQIRNYYNYGFKTSKELLAERKAMYIKRSRINGILADYITWNEENRSIQFISLDSQSMESNPFHKLYRFCGYKAAVYPAYFFHSIFAMNKLVHLRNGIESISFNPHDEFDKAERFEKHYAEDRSFQISELLQFYSKELLSDMAKDKTRIPTRRLEELAFLGIVKNEKEKHRWKLAPLTIGGILERGRQKNPGFEIRLKAAIDFYSRYYFLGEAGMLLMDRIEDGYNSPFRFKHDYFMQSMNNFHLIDLLDAIEKKKWCRIKYSQDLSQVNTEILCFPLEIRISTMNGREYLAYYEVSRRGYTYLRLEFIDSIEYFSDKEIKRVYVASSYGLTSEQIDHDISIAKELLQVSWGATTTMVQEHNLETLPKLYTVKMCIIFDPDKETYIYTRLLRERRTGKVSRPFKTAEGTFADFEVEVSHPWEMLSWIRSFYSRVVFCKILCDGREVNASFMERDVEAISEALLLESSFVSKPNDRMGKAWDIPEEIARALRGGSAANEHDRVFSAVFGVHYYIIADVLSQLCSMKEKNFNAKDLEIAIDRAFVKYKAKTGTETDRYLRKEIRRIILESGFVLQNEREKKFQTKYAFKQDVQVYRDLVPLSQAEVRWLMTILQDEKTEYFLSQKDKMLILDMIHECMPGVKPFLREAVNYYDRFSVDSERMLNERTYMNALIDAIIQHKELRVIFQSRKGNEIDSVFCPVVIEFSKRNNRFQVYLWNTEDRKIYPVNISEIVEVEITGNYFNYEQVRKEYQMFRDVTTKQVEIAFYDTDHILDRILTEFSPWRKSCLYDREHNWYKLTIYYPVQDETDLVIRLLGYGKKIFYCDHSHSIYTEIMRRIRMQMELNKNED